MNIRFNACFRQFIVLLFVCFVSCRKMALTAESGEVLALTSAGRSTTTRDIICIGSGTITRLVPKFESVDVIKLSTGTLLAVLSNEIKHGDKTAIYKCMSTDNGLTWTAPEQISMNNPHNYFMLNVNVFYVNNRLYLIIQRTPDGKNELGEPLISHSDDHGITWSDPQRILHKRDRGFIIINSRNITITNTGRVIVPVAYGQSINRVGVLYSDDHCVSWSEGPHPFGIKGYKFSEPSIARLADGRLIMLIRTAKGWIFKSYSDDNGTNWSHPVPTSLQSPWTAHTMRITPEGYIVVVFTNSPIVESSPGFPRNNLTFAVSKDNGATWGNYTLIAGPTNSDYIVMEPSITFVNDKILVSYLQEWLGKGIPPPDNSIRTVLYYTNEIIYKFKPVEQPVAPTIGTAKPGLF